MSTINLSDFLLCIGFSLLLGLLIAYCYMYKNNYSQSFIVTLSILPSIVCMIIMLVNGNIGAGVAVAGTFSLVRFRSYAGSGKEICMLLLATATGLITGMGYLGYGVLFVLIICAAYLLYNVMNFGIKRNYPSLKTLRIVIPEDLDYTGIFDDIFEKYVSEYELINVKTTNMGSMYKLTYDINLKSLVEEKQMIDELRCRNGNLEINVSKRELNNVAL